MNERLFYVLFCVFPLPILFCAFAERASAKAGANPQKQSKFLEVIFAAQRNRFEDNSAALNGTNMLSLKNCLRGNPLRFIVITRVLKETFEKGRDRNGGILWDDPGRAGRLGA